MDFSGSPVDAQIVSGQPGVSQNVVVLFAKAYHKEMLHGIPFFNSEIKFDLVVNHPFLVVGSISVSGIHGVSEFFQWPVHPSGKVKVNATDGFPTVYQGSGFSNFSIFCLVKCHRDSD